MADPRFDVTLNEGNDGANDRVLHSCCEEGQASAHARGDIPLILICIILLPGEEQDNNGHDFRQGDLGEIPGDDLGLLSILLSLQHAPVSNALVKP